MRGHRVVLLPAAALLAACADSPTSPTRVSLGDPALQASEGRGVFQRYVAIGTSLSMGWASDGGLFTFQHDSWPAQLARMANREITQPYIQSPGCRSPIAPPLGGNVRISGEPILGNTAALSCAPLVPGVTLPTQNVSVNAARVADALFTTPENTLDLSNRQLYTRVLPPGATQVSAMEAQNPKIVSVELGANEVLGAQSGLALVGAPPLPILDPATFAAQYRQVLDRVEGTGAKHVLLVGLSTSPFTLPAFRSGAEIAANAAALLVGFNVALQPDCATTNAANMIYVPLKLATTMQAGLIARAASQPPVPFSCAASGPTTPDFVLTPQEQAIAIGVVAQMNAAIQAEAQARGFAFISLDVLFAAPGVRTPLNVVALFTTAQPFGPFMSLDGTHPNAAGQALIAEAAARALNQRYDLGIPEAVP
jgi:lysophospholipase L1-like esterase